MGRTTSAPQNSPTATHGRGMHIALWVLQVLLALNFLGAGLAKIAGTDAMVDMFDEIGAGQWFRYLVGILELAGAIGLVIPALSGLAALCLCGLMVGATITNVAVIDDPPWVPLVILVFSAVVAWGRWAETKALLARFRGAPT